MSGAGQALQEMAISAVGALAELNGAFALGPVQAAFPYATVDAGLEADWSHKSGKGREVRLAITIRDEGERPDRLQRLMADAEAAIEEIDAGPQGWTIVSLRFLRSRIVREPRQGWTAAIDYRARMLSSQIF